MTDFKLNIYNYDTSNINAVYIYPNFAEIASNTFNEHEYEFIKRENDNKINPILLNIFPDWEHIVIVPEVKDQNEGSEKLRQFGAKVAKHAKKNKTDTLNIIDCLKDTKQVLDFIQGFVLASYTFEKYLTDKKETRNLLSLNILSKNIDEKDLEFAETLIKGVLKVRDLVNEPASHLTSEILAQEAEKSGNETGIKVTVLHKEEIEKLKMGGILAVNQGSTQPPTFTSMTWKPKNSINKKPIILIGKGITYDTGGLSLKPTENSMDEMKSDMAGAAVVMNTICVIAKLKLPIYVISLIPSTDNRLSSDSYSPGDVITMYSGTTVEVLNSDAEGRLILADALSYAQQFKPELAITVATLTGAAARAIGEKGAVVMGNAPEETMQELIKAGYTTNERLVEFPFWDDYAEELKSEIADLKNIGSNQGGAITAGKFLEKFAPKPFIHLDIAGTSFFKKPKDYFTFGGTGFGVRLLTEFIINYYKLNK